MLFVFSFAKDSSQNKPVISPPQHPNSVADWDTNAVKQWLERIRLSK
jgi:hypothetical protein